MRIHPEAYSRHADHVIYVDTEPRDKKGNLITAHHASLRCYNCDAWIKWLSKSESDELLALGLGL
jgi:hypothetical protein